MKDLLERFETKKPEVVFEWKDSKTEAEGWVVINSLRGGAAGGGTRMRKGLDKREVESLAKTMEVKFTVSGPAIGGAKSGINFDPNDPRKAGVLKRWYKAVLPLLKNYYGTGGDMNVDEVHDVIPITSELGLLHPQEGVLQGHFNPGTDEKDKKIEQLQVGVSKPIEDEAYTPELARGFVVADMITGWGVAESVKHYYHIFGGELKGKRVLVQGWGNVGSAAAYYLAKEGAIITGIIAHVGGLVKPEGFSFEEIRQLFLDKEGNKLVAENLIPFEEIEPEFWGTGAEIFIPCAASRLITKEQVDAMIEGGLEVVSAGANVPFADKEIFFGPIADYTDDKVSVIPDFISNCGMARAFAYFMHSDIEMTDEAIFDDVSKTIYDALHEVHKTNPNKTHIAKSAFDIALKQLI